MKLRQLCEDELSDSGRLIATLASDENAASYASSPDFKRFVNWTNRPDPKTWDTDVKRSLERLSKELFQAAKTKEDQRAARLWGDVARMPGATAMAAMASAPDGVAKQSLVADLDVPDAVSNPIRQQLGDAAYSALIVSLGRDQTLLNRVLKAIQSGISTLQ